MNTKQALANVGAFLNGIADSTWIGEMFIMFLSFSKVYQYFSLSSI